jgi:hypothetical protein
VSVGTGSDATSSRGPIDNIASSAAAVRRLPARARACARGLGAAACAALVFAFAWVYRFNDPGGAFAYLTDDHFFYLVRGWQILFGELPARDFVDHGAPLFYYIAAAVQLLFGRGTLSEVAFCVTVLAACAVGVFVLSARASGSLLLALAAAAFHILLGPRFYNYPKILVYVAAIPALWAFADRPDRRRAAMVAIITAIAFLFRHDHSVYLAGAFTVLLMLVPALSWRDRARHALVYAAFVLALVTPYLAFIELNGGIASYLGDAAAWAARDRDRAEVVWPGLFDNPDGISAAAKADDLVTRAIGTVRDNAIAWLFYAELALPAIVLLVLAASPRAGRRRWPNASVKMAVVAALAAILNAGFLRSPLEARLADPSVPHAIMLAWLPVGVSGLWRSRDALRRLLRRPLMALAVRATSVAVVLPLLAIVGVATTESLPRRLETVALDQGLNEALEQMRFTWQRIGQAFPVVPDKSAEADDLMTLALYLRECTRPTDRVFMQHYLPQVVALAERGFAGGHADLRPGFFQSEEAQRLTVERLRRQSVPVALLGAGDTLGGFRASFPLVVAYLDEHYENAGERVFGGRFSTRLLVRRDLRPVRRFQPLDWPCFR